MEPIELEESTGRKLQAIPGPLVPEPLPARLVAVETVRLPAPAGVETLLDRLYVDILGFERGEDLHDPLRLVYHAENHALHFGIDEPPIERDKVVPLGIEVPSFDATIRALHEHEIHFERIRGITPGSEHLFLQDPAGNYLALIERRALM